MHNFFVPVTNQVVTKPKKTEGQKATADRLDKYSRYRVFGMTVSCPSPETLVGNKNCLPPD